MSYAYDYVTEQEKNSITNIKLFYLDASFVSLMLEGNSIDGLYSYFIHYESEGNDTSVKLNKNDLIFPNDLTSVILEDLKLLLKNQKTILNSLHFVFPSTEDYRNIAVYLRCIEETLKARSSALAVKYIQFSGPVVTAAWPIVCFLNSFELRLVYFDGPPPAMPTSVNFESHLNGLRELGKGYRFILDISVKTLKMEYLMVINEFPSFSESLRDFQLTFKDLQHQDDCDTVLSDKLFVEKKDELWILRFKLSNPREQEPPADTVEEIGRSVLENPLLMQSILHQLECFDIERLRKVKSGIRKCIDEVKPDPHIEKFSITFDILSAVNLPEIRVRLKSGEFKTISYKTKEGESLVNRRRVPGFNRMTLCLNDFEATLKHQKSCMEELLIIFKFTHFERLDSCVRLCKEMGNILKRREHPLKTQKLSMAYGSQQDIMEILPAVDKYSLKIIEVSDPSDQECMAFFGIEELPFEVDQLSQTGQWKNAEHLIVKDLTVPSSIQDINILHFSSLEVLVKTLSSQDVDYLKTNLLKSSNFEKFKIFFWETTIDESLHELIGEPFRIISGSKKVWYFRINTNDYIHIVLDTRAVRDSYGKLKPKGIIFTRVAKEDTPFF